MFPIIPLTALLAIVGGVYTLGWYMGLDPNAQAMADKRANKIAWDCFNKALNCLTPDEAIKVANQLNREFSLSINGADNSEQDGNLY